MAGAGEHPWGDAGTQENNPEPTRRFWGARGFCVLGSARHKWNPSPFQEPQFLREAEKQGWFREEAEERLKAGKTFFSLTEL